MALTASATCEARVGFHPGEWAEMPVFCRTFVGLTTWVDINGRTHRACRHHLAAMLRRNPQAHDPGCPALIGEDCDEAVG
jgi:hypothetical protein